MKLQQMGLPPLLPFDGADGGALSPPPPPLKRGGPGVAVPRPAMGGIGGPRPQISFPAGGGQPRPQPGGDAAALARSKSIEVCWLSSSCARRGA